MSHQTTPEGLAALVLGGRAQIVITLDVQGRVALQSCIDGRPDAAYFHMTDARLLERTLPGLLGELRAQIQEAPEPPVTAQQVHQVHLLSGVTHVIG